MDGTVPMEGMPGQEAEPEVVAPEEVATANETSNKMDFTISVDSKTGMFISPIPNNIKLIGIVTAAIGGTAVIGGTGGALVAGGSAAGGAGAASFAIAGGGAAATGAVVGTAVVAAVALAAVGLVTVAGAAGFFIYLAVRDKKPDPIRHLQWLDVLRNLGPEYLRVAHEGDSRCRICEVNVPNCRFNSCGHEIACSRCLVQLYENPEKLVRCKVCGKVVDGLTVVYSGNLS